MNPTFFDYMFCLLFYIRGRQILLKKRNVFQVYREETQEVRIKFCTKKNMLFFVKNETNVRYSNDTAQLNLLLELFGRHSRSLSNLFASEQAKWISIRSLPQYNCTYILFLSFHFQFSHDQVQLVELFFSKPAWVYPSTTAVRQQI